MNLEDMKNTVETQMKKLNIPHNVIKKAVNILPALGRWRSK
jgi:galactitol-specific phosphotransferase system IIB component